MAVYPTPLTPYAINVALQTMTIQALGLPPHSFSQVRVDWQTQGQPAWPINSDLCFLRAVEVDDFYNRIRDVETIYNDDETVTLLTTYTRVWRVFWMLYGPNSFDRARILRSALFGQTSHDFLAASQLFFMTDPAAPVRVPELRDGQWWERVDFTAEFNEAVYETETAGLVKSVEIVVEDSSGTLADVTVSS